jgi:predicted transglutaminase-like protease
MSCETHEVLHGQIYEELLDEEIINRHDGEWEEKLIQYVMKKVHACYSVGYMDGLEDRAKVLRTSQERLLQ